MKRRKSWILLLIALLLGGVFATLHAQRSAEGSRSVEEAEAIEVQAEGPLAWVREFFDWLTPSTVRIAPARPSHDDPGARRHDQGPPGPDADGCGNPSPGGSEDDCGPYLDPDG